MRQKYRTPQQDSGLPFVLTFLQNIFFRITSALIMKSGRSAVDQKVVQKSGRSAVDQELVQI